MTNIVLKKAKNVAIILTITIVLFELVSFIILNTFSGRKEQSSSGLSIFEKTNNKGYIEVTKSWVLPVKRNYTFQWTTSEFNVTVHTNDNGFREMFEVDNADVDIAFFGDSFSFGHGVEDNQRYSYIFSQNAFFSKYKVVNFSYLNGSQPEHYECYLRNNFDLHPKHVIIGLYLGNDLDSDIDETVYDFKTNKLTLPHRLISDNGTLRNNPGDYKFPINHFIDVSYFFTFFVKMINRTHYRAYLFKPTIHPNHPNNVKLELGKEDLTRNRAILSLIRIQKLLIERGSKLTILLIPQNYFFISNFETAHIHIHGDLKNRIFEVKQGNNILKATKIVLSELNIDYFDPSKILNQQHYFKKDAHWNASGHNVIGYELANYIKDKL